MIVEDINSAETREWLEAFDEAFEFGGPQVCEEILQKLHVRARSLGVNLKPALNTPYVNSVPLDQQPEYPGDIELERRITSIVRWNALAMVVGANRDGMELGGHLASYASAADLFEVGFNHFFRGSRGTGPKATADLIFFQPHSAPGIYARAFLEERLTAEQLHNFRREVGGAGLSSYPHPWLMPKFWQFPTGSMGLGPLTAVYQARFMRYLEHRRLIEPTDREVWAFVGDGEMDEPESLAGLSLASRECLDNLIFVVNCNLQRLDGPVRGNGSIIQELERVFSGAGWKVIKLLWGSNWDAIFSRDPGGILLKRLAETIDGELLSYGSRGADFNRTEFFNKYEELRDIVSQLTDEEIDALIRGGHDPIKIYAAFQAATHSTGSPVVILAQTKKGYGLGPWVESRIAAHQQKKLTEEALKAFRDRFELPISDEDTEKAQFYCPPRDSREMRYLRLRREELGGFVPERSLKVESRKGPAAQAFAQFAFQEEAREFSTTMAFVRMLNGLLKLEDLSEFVVPIIADEARTFGMESMFRKIGIYSPAGQLYEPEDKANFLHYKEAKDGQILEEGITEAGALSSWIAAATSYSNHGLPMLPFYIFYSIFGFQRTGDLLWAAADSRARGFLLGATAGRTTLSGEGLQHQDGTSHLMASTIPNCRAYDPCYAYEVAVILEHGFKTILERQDDVFYYLTLYNEQYLHPSVPPAMKDGIVKGMYLLRSSPSSTGDRGRISSVGADSGKACMGQSRAPRVQLLGSGTILREALAASELLEHYGIAADVWSVTSFTELRRSALEIERDRQFRLSSEPQLTWIEQCLDGTEGPVVAASDYVRAVPDLIRTWIHRRYITLGTDGFGRSDTRAALRRFFEIDSKSIAITAMSALVHEGTIKPSLIADFVDRHAYRTADRAAWADHSLEP